MHACICMYIYTCIHIHTNVYICVQIHIYIHIFTHTRTHPHTPVPSRLNLGNSRLNIFCVPLTDFIPMLPFLTVSGTKSTHGWLKTNDILNHSFGSWNFKTKVQPQPQFKTTTSELHVGILPSLPSFPYLMTGKSAIPGLTPKSLQPLP